MSAVTCIQDDVLNMTIQHTLFISTCISNGNVIGIKIRTESSDIKRDYDECQESGCYVGHNRNVIELTLLYLLIHLPLLL